MSESADKDSKTEEATEKRIRDTVEKGKLPHSREAALLASFVAILIFAVFFAADSIGDLGYPKPVGVLVPLEPVDLGRKIKKLVFKACPCMGGVLHCVSFGEMDYGVKRRF